MITTRNIIYLSSRDVHENIDRLINTICVSSDNSDKEMELAFRLSREQYTIDANRRNTTVSQPIQAVQVRNRNIQSTIKSTVQSAVQSKSQQIPQRVLNAYIESSIAKNETCPITIMPIEKSDAIVTPCYHIMSKSAGEQWISMKNQCPVCKESCTSNQTMKWVNI